MFTVYVVCGLLCGSHLLDHTLYILSDITAAVCVNNVWCFNGTSMGCYDHTEGELHYQHWVALPGHPMLLLFL